MKPGLAWVVFWCLNVPFLFIHHSWGQTDSTHVRVQWSGFVDVYYFLRPGQTTKDQGQPFLFNHDRIDDISINLALIKGAIQGQRYRANLAFQTGTYVEENYAQEPDIFKFVHEANAGFAIDRAGKVWLDAGILPSHIGFESAISKDNVTLSRSLLAENSPYYETGAQLSYRPRKTWYFSVLVLNGWQRIRKVDGNSTLSLGHRIMFQPSEKYLFNWSTFFGTDDPDEKRRWRFFQNWYFQGQFSEKFTLVAGFDVGIQQDQKGSSDINVWYSPVVIGQWKFNDQWKLALRGEYYTDPGGVIINLFQPETFSLGGASCNLDYQPAENIFARVELRWLTGFADRRADDIRLGFSLAASF